MVTSLNFSSFRPNLYVIGPGGVYPLPLQVTVETSWTDHGSPLNDQSHDFFHAGSPFWPFLQMHLIFLLRPPCLKRLSLIWSWFEESPQKIWVTGRFLLNIFCTAALVPFSSSDMSGHVIHGENLECDQVSLAWHFTRHLPLDRHPMGQTAAQYAPSHFTSTPFSGTLGLSPQSCHCLFDLSWFKFSNQITRWFTSELLNANLKNHFKFWLTQIMQHYIYWSDQIGLNVDILFRSAF